MSNINIKEITILRLNQACQKVIHRYLYFLVEHEYTWNYM